MRKLNVKLFLGLVCGCFLLVGLVVLVHWLQAGRIARGFLVRADRAEQQGDPKEAARYFGRYLELVPTDAEARARLGKVLADETVAVTVRTKTRALFVLEEALGKLPERNDLRFLLVRLATELQRHDLAREHLDKLNEAQPDDPEVT